jgi:ActR/RegA family two-component response regulator
MSYKINNIDFSEIVDVYDIHGHDREVEVLGYDEAGNEYSACAMESVGELVEVFEDTIELISKADSNAPIYYTYVMKKKDSFGIDVIKPVRTEWFPGMDTPDEVWDPEYLGDR